MKNEALAVERTKAQKEVALKVLDILNNPTVSLMCAFAVLESLRTTTFARELGGWTLWKWDLPTMRVADALEVVVAAPYVLETAAKIIDTTGSITKQLPPLALALR